eukprot:CAMPEP_0172551568 /NCGR_PEP_ID=MMETSP1067-20121228/40079_1 /TAXON_ID=265564 ORGANISM="Thalassiosira punctigera, Strain Tpunct2005C2" /NCGR_SAMPLE_ID=MMETSP1067 /ASSEMBLY_ACC=CAM_ASM_000444 /LENGTH=359 /DNA_ID=CAMNT_0013339373 /DNA_START=149 /DNA_END=1225 /DNA_ORIENTATION=-
MDNSAARPPTLEASPLHSERCSPSSEPAVKTAPSLLSSTDEVKRQTPAKDAVAGAFSGAFAKTVVAPIERVKLLMQLQFSIENSSKNGGRTSSATAQTPSTERSTKKYGAWEFAKIVYREQGILAFWRGNTPNVIRQGGTSAMNFLLMDWYKKAISPLLVWSLQLPSNRDHEKRQKRRVFLSSFLSGGLAGGTVTTVLYPVEFVRTRLAMDVGKGTPDAPRLYPGGIRDVCLSIWRADGWRGLYQGYGIALAGVVLYRALHLGGYDAVKTEILHRRGHRAAIGDFHITNDKKVIELTNKSNLLLGGTSGESRSLSSASLTMGERFLAAQIVSIVAGTACYPIDSIRRRLMMQAGLPKEE